MERRLCSPLPARDTPAPPPIRSYAQRRHLPSSRLYVQKHGLHVRSRDITVYIYIYIGGRSVYLVHSLPLHPAGREREEGVRLLPVSSSSERWRSSNDDDGK